MTEDREWGYCIGYLEGTLSGIAVGLAVALLVLCEFKCWKSVVACAFASAGALVLSKRIGKAKEDGL